MLVHRGWGAGPTDGRGRNFRYNGPGTVQLAGPQNMVTVPCPCERVESTYAQRDKCKPMGTLQVLLEGVDRVGGVWRFRTTSWNSVNAILSSLVLIKTITGGVLSGILLHLVLSPKTVTVPAGPTAGQNMVVYVMSLEYRGPEKNWLSWVTTSPRNALTARSGWRASR